MRTARCSGKMIRVKTKKEQEVAIAIWKKQKKKERISLVPVTAAAQLLTPGYLSLTLYQQKSYNQLNCLLEQITCSPNSLLG